VRADEVAQLAGVSRSTVSRVFTPSTYVAEQTRSKVMHAAELLGYRPNVIARSLTMRRTRLVGVVTGHLENPAHATLVRQIAAGLQDEGLATLLVTAHYNELDRVLQSLMSYQIDAMVVTSAVPVGRISLECEKAGIPLVVTNKQPEPVGGMMIHGDDVLGVGLVTDHLVAEGWKRFAYISGLPDVPNSSERENVYTLALARHGIPLMAREYGNYTYEDATGAMRALLSRPMRPDAVFCANDIMAIAALDVARLDFGLTPGVDIAVVGYDDTPLASVRSYDLTSVRQNVPGIIKGIVTFIAESGWDNPSANRVQTIPPELVVRSSSVRAGKTDTP